VRTLAGPQQVTAAADEHPPGGRHSPHIALARAEGRHLLRHPAFLVGAVASVVLLAGTGVARGVDFSTLALSGFGCLPLVVGTFVATNLGARRERRSGSEELLDALPTTARTRTAAQLIAVAAALSVAVATVIVTALVTVALGGPEVRFATGVERRMSSLAESAQGPLAVAALGLVGVAVGRLVPGPLLAPALGVVLLVSMFPDRWFAPVVNPAVTVPGGYWPHPEIAPRTELLAFDVQSVSWHLLYLVGVGGLAAAAAVGRHRLTPAVWATATTSLMLTAAGAVLQLR